MRINESTDKIKRNSYLIISATLFAVDRIIKSFIPRVRSGDDFITIGLYKNYAGAFSLPIAGTVYNILGGIFIAILLYWYIVNFRRGKYLQSAAYLLIVLGGASNLFDRLYFGYVIDYVQIINRSFFNVADLMLVGGVGILIARRLKLKNFKFQAPNSKQISKN